MTELATPPTEQQQRITRISHWIGGRPSRGVGPQRPGLQPGDRRSRPARVDFASIEEIDAAVAAAKAAFPAWRVISLSRRTELFFRIRAARRRAPRGPRAAADGRARQGALRRAGRGHPRARGDRVRLRDPRPAEGRLLRAGLDRDRRLLDPAAARRRRRDHAVQLPGDGAHVDVGAGARVRQHVRAEAVGEGPVGVDPTRPSCSRRRASRTASSTSSTATRSRSTDCSSTRTSPRSRSSARRRSRSTSTRPARPTASASRRSAARRTT